MQTYKDAGVNIAAGEATVDRIKPLVRSTFTPGVMTDIGMFGAFFDAKFTDYEHPVLVSSVDGVGTKLKLAFMSGVHTTVGQDLVNHCVNDILACGARPLFFLDYFATGKLEPDVAAQVIEGFTIACKQNRCALIGGETAEMPSMYAEGEYDLAGTVVGVVDKSKIIDGSGIRNGDVVLGLPSTGLHTNGYSLARAALLPRYTLDQRFDDLEGTLGEALMAVHRSYLDMIFPLLDRNLVRGLAHITGGGLQGNTRRIIPQGLQLEFDWSAWETPPIFRLIQSTAGISDEEMRQAFNLGIGMVIIIAPEHVATVTEMCGGEPMIIGAVRNA